MATDDLRSAALSAMYALENLERDTPQERWFYDGVLARLKHALGRRESSPDETVSLAELAAAVEEGEAD